MIDKLIRKSTILGSTLIIEKYVAHFYKFPIFRNILNVTFSLIEELRLFLKIYNSQHYQTDGLCQTLSSSTTKSKQYIITIWKETPYVVMHEICHMIEKEADLNLQKDFLPVIHEDLKNINNTNILIQELVKQVIFKEIKLYPDLALRSSELFARFFELFAWTQELYPKERSYLVRIKDLKLFFANTYKWVFASLNQILEKKIHNNIKDYSNSIAFIDLRTQKPHWTSKFDKISRNFKPKI